MDHHFQTHQHCTARSVAAHVLYPLFTKTEIISVLINNGYLKYLQNSNFCCFWDIHISEGKENGVAIENCTKYTEISSCWQAFQIPDLIQIRTRLREPAHFICLISTILFMILKGMGWSSQFHCISCIYKLHHCRSFLSDHPILINSNIDILIYINEYFKTVNAVDSIWGSQTSWLAKFAWYNLPLLIIRRASIWTNHSGMEIMSTTFWLRKIKRVD